MRDKSKIYGLCIDQDEHTSNEVNYKSVNVISPIDGQCYVVSDGVSNYNLAFWDDKMGFINQYGPLPNILKFYTELPIYKQ